MIDLQESRYDRQERISWWDQARLASAHVLVVGAGALGNEIVKNLALVGVGSIDVVDMDAIERSNLARCALFRDSDEGRFKAEVLAEAALAVNPTIRTRAFVCAVQEWARNGWGSTTSFSLDWTVVRHACGSTLPAVVWGRPGSTVPSKGCRA